jgi:predicted ATPase
LPELYRIKGKLLLRQGGGQSGSAAEWCFSHALAVAGEQGALLWELRSAISLARLQMTQNRRDQALHVLTSVYARFTEGFAVADLKAAKALLDDLS